MPLPIGLGTHSTPGRIRTLNNPGLEPGALPIRATDAYAEETGFEPVRHLCRLRLSRSIAYRSRIPPWWEMMESNHIPHKGPGLQPSAGPAYFIGTSHRVPRPNRTVVCGVATHRLNHSATGTWRRTEGSNPHIVTDDDCVRSSCNTILPVLHTEGERIELPRPFLGGLRVQTGPLSTRASLSVAEAAGLEPATQ